MPNSTPAPSRQSLRLEHWPPDQLTAHPYNNKIHSSRQRATLHGALDEVGWAGAALFNEATGRLLDGHLRQEVGDERRELVPVLIGSWTEEEELVILATLDPIAYLASLDPQATRELTEGLSVANEHLSDLLIELRTDNLPANEPDKEEKGDKEGEGESDGKPVFIALTVSCPAGHELAERALDVAARKCGGRRSAALQLIFESYLQNEEESALRLNSGIL